jgi:4-hydroxy-tetrahydrodipicolinate reductase
MPAECEVTEGSETVKVKLIAPEAAKAALEEAKKAYENLVIIDFTHPSAVNSNSELYCAAGVPWVMGTTGGDREKMMQVTRDSGCYAVIAPNMAKQIVALQATMERMAKDFPGAFSGYTLEVTESHQKTKADTSGTAKAMVDSFSKLGLDFKVDDIKKLRDDDSQKAFGVPEDHLNGHAFHTYTLKSGDGSVEFQFKHNVCGRLTYSEGVVDAVKFLAAQKAKGESQKVYSMIDVLSAGAMR